MSLLISSVFLFPKTWGVTKNGRSTLTKTSNFRLHNQLKKRLNQKVYDCIIIGGGPAGIAALLWFEDLCVNAVLLESASKLGGQLLRTYNPIRNYAGVAASNGQEFQEILWRQIEHLNAKILTKVEILAADLHRKELVLSDGSQINGKTILIATGVRRRKLNVPGEDAFEGLGVLHSGVKNRETVAGKRVLIVGGGDAAFENALILSQTAAFVYLVHRGTKFKARPDFVARVRATENVEIVENTRVVAIRGSEKVDMVELCDANEDKRSLAVDFVLIRVGVQPNSEIFSTQLDLDKLGFIQTRCCDLSTSIEDVYAIGDITNPGAPTISTAVGHAALAAREISAKIQKNRESNTSF